MEGAQGEGLTMEAHQGGRVASGLGMVSALTALTTILRPLVKAPVMAYIEAMRCIEQAAIIPDVLEFAQIALETAEDQKHFGTLSADPLSVDGIAFFMTYSAEATHPPLYNDRGGTGAMDGQARKSRCGRWRAYSPVAKATRTRMGVLTQVHVFSQDPLTPSG
eukprot:COSAG02_NODE_18139_length_958_cov_1.370198_1_plen_162_part_10